MNGCCPEAPAKKYLKLKCRVRGEGRRARPAGRFKVFQLVWKHQLKPGDRSSIINCLSAISKNMTEKFSKFFWEQTQTFLAKQEVEVTSAAGTDF